MSAFPIAVDPGKVGRYPALTKSGGGLVYDEVLEYRVWVHPELGGEPLSGGDDYFHAFATFEEALAFSESTSGAEPPLVLVLQREYVNEPSPGEYVHVKGERITEWRVEWLKGSRRAEGSIAGLLKQKSRASD